MRSIVLLAGSRAVRVNWGALSVCYSGLGRATAHVDGLTHSWSRVRQGMSKRFSYSITRAGYYRQFTNYGA